MAVLRPFRGILYDPRRVDLSRVVAPPYDVISPKDQARYYAQDPHNVVRLIAGEVRPTDSPDDNKYVRAAGFFNSWLQEGILGWEPEPSLYIYRHEFVDPTGGQRKVRHGILGVVELEPFGSTILPHERTHPRAKADRLSLTRAVHANLSPIFSMYEDPGRIVPSILESAVRGQPRFSFDAGEGERHAVWSVRDHESIQRLVEALRPSRLYVADGHHRYETALNFRNKMRAEHPDAPPNAAFNYVLMLLVDLDDPGLMILPTHRTVQLPGFPWPSFLKLLDSQSRVSIYPDEVRLIQALNEAVDAHRLGLVMLERTVAGAGDDGRLTYATFDIARRLSADPVSELDVSVLHRQIIHGILGIWDSALEDEHFVSYSRDLEASLERVREGAAQAAFLLRPPAVSDVIAVARAGQVMPQKSTYFYPKPASGIVFNPLGADIRI